MSAEEALVGYQAQKSMFSYAAFHVHPDQYHDGFPRLLGAIGFVRKRPCRGSGQSCRENGVAL
ncbi:uncharacterized protein CIMG_04216 [Coccidioides immitis RS]|uniref:Uncharacterized protein n=1 Tax=Coccidioides immitis (strain RS) TaxID=246410 RepID=J3KD18_COCIM|nr:uncharacterized protein CIMG_04216 [Coccidioides immitis RS]EAS33192.3 hypothetical protein CIMG_04216 [Coccidioides immitis RS]